VSKFLARGLGALIELTRGLSRSDPGVGGTEPSRSGKWNELAQELIRVVGTAKQHVGAGTASCDVDHDRGEAEQSLNWSLNPPHTLCL
jgi:hypothetical protein